jgi:hypothetical protein
LEQYLPGVDECIEWHGEACIIWLQRVEEASWTLAAVTDSANSLPARIGEFSLFVQWQYSIHHISGTEGADLERNGKI